MTTSETPVIANAKNFRQQILNPADGVFLFHARAIERLIQEQLGAQASEVSIPDLPYYLMRREDFLFGLETENPEALSVIEGLKLPHYVLLLPSPRTPGIDGLGFRRLRHDYWARTFEAEVARHWQLARDRETEAADEPAQNQKQAHKSDFSAQRLRALVGPHGFAELRSVLDRDGLILPIWDDNLICRAFIARVVRLRYFAPGARAFYFPAVQDWARIDTWLTASGLHLPPPPSLAADTVPAWSSHDPALPQLLHKTRPNAGDAALEPLPLLPGGLTRGERDPDYAAAQQAIHAAAARRHQVAQARQAAAPPPAAVPQAFEARCRAALHEAVRIRPKRAFAARFWDHFSARLSRLIGRIVFAPSLEYLQNRPRQQPSGVWLEAGLSLLRHAMAAAVRNERRGRFACALVHLADARRLLLRLMQFCGDSASDLCQTLAAHEADCEQSLAAELAAKLALRPEAAKQLDALVQRLAAEDRGLSASPVARAVLSQLEQVLGETRDDYYRLRLWGWMRSRGQIRLREMLPFQAPLHCLRSLQIARVRIDDLDWPLHELEVFAKLLEQMRTALSQRLEAQLMPRLTHALRQADFVPRNHRERVAEHKMRCELLDVIKQRRQLKFTDVRDIVARNVLRLPDSTLEEFYRGDRLRRFDHTAAQALPGVYRPGEIYIKGLQQLSAPLFGTRAGRAVLRHVLVPFGVTYLVLKSIGLILHLFPEVEPSFHLATPLTVTAGGTLANLVIHTDIGRHVLHAIWHGSRALFDFLVIQAPWHLLAWPPLSGLLGTGLIRGLARHFIQPLLFGILPLTPIIALAVLVEEVPIKPGFWLLALAFALGTLARNTPAGRRFIDNLVTHLSQLQRRINQTLVLGLIQHLLYLFKEATRRIAQALHRVEEALTHHLQEPLGGLLLKALAAPLWAFAEALLQFYITVLVEPQINPVKHFPIVTIGHKLMLPFLPGITALMLEMSDSILPGLIGIPLITLTVVLLPGLFGFVVWELKENWKLYQANHSAALRGVDAQGIATLALEPAVIGSHGETMRGILYRGFHSGALPKAYDRVRAVIEQQLRDQSLYPRKVRVCERRLRAIEHSIRVFIDRELSFALRERCRTPDCALSRVATQAPELATNLIELKLLLYAQSPATVTEPHQCPQVNNPVALHIEIFRQKRDILLRVSSHGDAGLIAPSCWAMILEDLRVFAGRADARFEPSASLVRRARLHSLQCCCKPAKHDVQKKTFPSIPSTHGSLILGAASSDSTHRS
ncbi:sulfite exporter TauE/SafE family protein [Rhabdochromatium marinum]|uniref:sulfite exporter TauE/SafE family protein n=1 Tax=Rhabdochromatium marinum TaxID=48729 RepID=UPI0019061470|nr:sulfite exporter TauE/SafE family protein [Rhabdochromatium marinum]